jgi:hypothetical protein
MTGDRLRLLVGRYLCRGPGIADIRKTPRGETGARVRCPFCTVEMKEGVAQIRGTWLSFFLVGLSYQILFFDSGAESRAILESRERRPAYHCDSCGTTVVAGEQTVGPQKMMDPKTGIITEAEG